MESARFRTAAVMFGGFVLALLALALGLYVIVGRGPATHSVAAASVGHIHGLGVNPATGRLFVAAHNGVFEVRDGDLTRVADRWQDTMGFAVVGPDEFLASGHPDLRETRLPSQLGLIESVDAAVTWRTLSLQGEADLHALEPTDRLLYAYDATSGSLIATEDSRSWRVIDQRLLIDLAVGGGGQLYATSVEGRLLRYGEATAEPSTVPNAPVLTFIDASSGGLMIGVGPQGRVYVSDDGSSWSEAGAVSGVPSAIDASAAEWHVATDLGVYRSTDQGRTWERIIGVRS